MTAVGLTTVLSAEIGQIVFSLALATLGASKSARSADYQYDAGDDYQPRRKRTTRPSRS